MPIAMRDNPSSRDKKEGPIQNKEVKDVSKEALPLPAGFEWSTIDLTDD